VRSATANYSRICRPFTAVIPEFSPRAGIELYDPLQRDDFANALKARNRDVLVVGHSNTTPVLVGLLVGNAIGDRRLAHHLQYALAENLDKQIDLFVRNGQGRGHHHMVAHRPAHQAVFVAALVYFGPQRLRR